MKVPIKLKYGKETAKGRIGSDWNQYTFSEYVNYLKQSEEGGKLDIYSALTGISSEMWGKPHDVKLFANIDKVLSFLQHEPLTDVPTHIERNGTFYPINDDFMTMKLSDYWDMIELINSVHGKEDVKEWEKVAVMSKLIAIIACKEYKNIDQINNIAAEIDQMPSDVVYSIGCFFLRKLTVLKSSIENETKGGKNSVVTTLKQVLVKSLAILVICIHYIISPMATFRSVKKFFLQPWERFIRGGYYRIVSMTQTRNIKKY